MNNLPAKMKVITPLGEEEFNITLNNDKLTLSVFKGSADLNVETIDDSHLLAKGTLNVPFDCKMILELNIDNTVSGKVSLIDPLLDEPFLEVECKES